MKTSKEELDRITGPVAAVLLDFVKDNVRTELVRRTDICTGTSLTLNTLIRTLSVMMVHQVEALSHRRVPDLEAAEIYNTCYDMVTMGVHKQIEDEMKKRGMDYTQILVTEEEGKKKKTGDKKEDKEEKKDP